jgi:hypothetical protein
MSGKPKKTKPLATSPPVTDYRHKAKRKHIPPAGLAAQAESDIAAYATPGKV